MSDNPGTAVAVIDPKARSRSTKAEKLPPAEHLLVPSAILLAADAVSAHDAEDRAYLQGVFLHSKDGVGRAVGTDGKRMFVASFPLPEAAPSWLAKGVIVSNDGLKARLSMIAKEDTEGSVRLSYANGAPKLELTDPTRSMIFHTPICTGTFPEYERVLKINSFGELDEEGRPIGREWQPIGINSGYLKHCAEIAKVLEAGLPKSLRSKTGMVIRAFNTNGNDNAPLVFDFSTWPGAILIIMPAKLATAETSRETAALLAPAVKLTLAALRAHATRNQAWADAAEDPAVKANFEAKVEHFNERIAELLKRAPGLPALDAPEPEAEPQAEPEAQVDQPQPEPQPEDQPEADKPEETPEHDSTPANDEPQVTRRRVAMKNTRATPRLRASNGERATALRFPEKVTTHERHDAPRGDERPHPRTDGQDGGERLHRGGSQDGRGSGRPPA